MFAYSSALYPEFAKIAFDTVIHRDAQNGRINAEFANALDSQCGIALPAKVAEAFAFVNGFLGTEKKPSKVKGAPAVAASLHALCIAVAEAGKVKNLPAVAPLPAWADADKIAAAKAAAKAAKEAAAKAAAAAAIKAAANGEGGEGGEGSEGEGSDTPAVQAPDINKAVNLVLTAASTGALSQAQIDSLRAVFAEAVMAA